MSVSSEKGYELAQSIMKLFMFFKPKKNLYNIKPIEMMTIKSIAHIGAENTKDVTPKMICNELGLSKSALTAVLNSLEEKNFIERKLSKDDRRMILITLTEKASNFHEQFHLSMQNTLLNLAESLGEEETDKLIELLKKTYTYFSEK